MYNELPRKVMKFGEDDITIVAQTSCYSEDARTMNSCLDICLVTIECGHVLLTIVFYVFTPIKKCYTCNTIHHKKSFCLLVVKKMNTKMLSVHSLSVLTVITVA